MAPIIEHSISLPTTILLAVPGVRESSPMGRRTPILNLVLGIMVCLIQNQHPDVVTAGDSKTTCDNPIADRAPADYESKVQAAPPSPQQCLLHKRSNRSLPPFTHRLPKAIMPAATPVGSGQRTVTVAGH